MTFKLVTLSALALLATACTSVTPLQPAGEKVVVTNATPPATCHILKELSLTTTNGSDTHYRSHQDIQVDQLNQLRNNTASLGGNLFVLNDHDTTYQTVGLGFNKTRTDTDADAANKRDALVDTHQMGGAAYLCDAKTLAVLSQTPYKTGQKAASDLKQNN